jgi:ABC-type dipeptide/oligopeptide/nickel transport system ATPase component
MKMVRLPDPQRVADSYPHQISGGMQQRVLIALALSTSPRLLILDEPTTNLDVTTQASILDLFRDLIQGIQSSVLYVTHNLGVVAQMCDRVAVLYAGELSRMPPEDLFHRPTPARKGLLDSVPKLGQNKRKAPLQAIAARSLRSGRPSGCVFEPAARWYRHVENAPLQTCFRAHIPCHRWDEIAAGKQRPAGTGP